ncbi:MAG: type II secretion system F family protein [Acidimicrobiales bacterium]
MLLGASWASLVLVVARRRRPPPARARALAGPGTRRRREERGAGPDLLAILGAVVRRRFPTAQDGRPTPPACARAVGAVTVAVVVCLVVAPTLAPIIVVAGVVVPRSRARAAERRRLRSLEAALPDTVDLLVLAVGAGCNVPLALAAAGRRGSGVLAAELRQVMADVGRGRRLADALDDLPARAGEPTRALAAVLAGCERYGTPVLPALHRLADEVRLQRQRRAEAAARRVPVTLLFPLVLCILPAFALLTVAPLVAGALRELRL